MSHPLRRVKAYGLTESFDGTTIDSGQLRSVLDRNWMDLQLELAARQGSQETAVDLLPLRDLVLSTGSLAYLAAVREADSAVIASVSEPSSRWQTGPLPVSAWKAEAENRMSTISPSSADLLELAYLVEQLATWVGF